MRACPSKPHPPPWSDPPDSACYDDGSSHWLGIAMSAPPLTREMLLSIRSYEEFFSFCQSLRKTDAHTVFEFLFSIAISARGDGANSRAGLALIELDPRCPVSCAEVIETIAASSWDVSNREIPFYLISQFGKWPLAAAIQEFCERPDVSEQQRKCVESIWYWAGSPSARLTVNLFYWEWQKTIEGTDTQPFNPPDAAR